MGAAFGIWSHLGRMAGIQSGTHLLGGKKNAFLYNKGAKTGRKDIKGHFKHLAKKSAVALFLYGSFYFPGF
jgi:hypothetical protein